ncbi:unnamed protein product [Didymodactylos carnosus]|uniref:Esterase n=1 Tax=Didymodactylos carnosus TaxID=1234261 RepID=A0A815G7T9_9BILA|nr:unnamed protein product [Didymodactylos carnosus]CAF1335094.1 unnamed protein product [Didymodactylos carnosus]CAF3973625.1 unnamed protein product [Didymodactylos carnosus]CAF4191586.1 unnamed protein product [Didymodactylos carnosus]
MTEELAWLDYFVPLDSTHRTEDIPNNKRLLGDNVDDDYPLKQAKLAWNIGQNQKQYTSSYGSTFEVPVTSLSNRYFLIHESTTFQKTYSKVPLLIFFHGLNSTAWYSAVFRTKWIEHANTENFLLVFGQGQGDEFPDGPIRDKYGDLLFGDLYWEIEEPKTDFIYLDSILEYMKQHYENRLDVSRIYFVGYSNGALFSCNVAIHYGGGVFAAICNHCGGYGGGYKDEKLLNPNTIKKVIPIYLLTGTSDAYRSSCERAKMLFEGVGCDVKMDIMENRGHNYYQDKELDIWTFLMLYRINGD